MGELIGTIRQTRKTKKKIKLPIGYSTQKLLGERLTKRYQEQIETNESLGRVIAMNQDDDEVERILNDKQRDRDTMPSIGEGDEDEQRTSTCMDGSQIEQSRQQEDKQFMKEIAKVRPLDELLEEIKVEK